MQAVEIAAEASPWITPGGVTILVAVLGVGVTLIRAVLELRKGNIEQAHTTKAVERLGTKLDTQTDKLAAMDIRLHKVESSAEVIRRLSGGS